MLVLAFNFTFW
jgi:hypothetical protein